MLFLLQIIIEFRKCYSITWLVYCKIMPDIIYISFSNKHAHIMHRPHYQWVHKIKIHRCLGQTIINIKYVL